ncbi:hypothetical protein S245_047237, partial [Arachis hypogaea]
VLSSDISLNHFIPGLTISNRFVPSFGQIIRLEGGLGATIFDRRGSLEGELFSGVGPAGGGGAAGGGQSRLSGTGGGGSGPSAAGWWSWGISPAVVMAANQGDMYRLNGIAHVAGFIDQE